MNLVVDDCNRIGNKPSLTRAGGAGGKIKRPAMQRTRYCAIGNTSLVELPKELVRTQVLHCVDRTFPFY